MYLCLYKNKFPEIGFVVPEDATQDDRGVKHSIFLWVVMPRNCYSICNHGTITLTHRCLIELKAYWTRVKPIISVTIVNDTWLVTS